MKTKEVSKASKTKKEKELIKVHNKAVENIESSAIDNFDFKKTEIALAKGLQDLIDAGADFKHVKEFLDDTGEFLGLYDDEGNNNDVYNYYHREIQDVCEYKIRGSIRLREIEYKYKSIKDYVAEEEIKDKKINEILDRILNIPCSIENEDRIINGFNELIDAGADFHILFVLLDEFRKTDIMADEVYEYYRIQIKSIYTGRIQKYVGDRIDAYTNIPIKNHVDGD